MGFTVVQINIRSYNYNKYLLNLEINRCNADIILLNETGTIYNNNIKILGYNFIAINNTDKDGIAIIYKKDINIEHVYFENKDILAIKINSNFGPILIATTYSPPRKFTLPIVSLNRLFSFNIPVLLIADLNAKHPILNTLPPHSNRTPTYNPKGYQIKNIIERQNLLTLGP